MKPYSTDKYSCLPDIFNTVFTRFTGTDRTAYTETAAADKKKKKATKKLIIPHWFNTDLRGILFLHSLYYKAYQS